MVMRSEPRALSNSLEREDGCRAPLMPNEGAIEAQSLLRSEYCAARSVVASKGVFATLDRAPCPSPDADLGIAVTACMTVPSVEGLRVWN